MINQMNFDEAIRSGFQNQSDFHGRATRSEYWWFAAFRTFVGLFILLPGIFRIIGAIGILVTIVPGLSEAVRRLHDVGKSGWWLLIAITVVGDIPLIYWFVKDSDPDTNAFGPCPKSRT